MKTFKQITEQYREKGRFHPVKPYNVHSVAAATPRKDSDSANVGLKEGEFKKEWSKTGKEATHRESGEKTYEYQELGHDGKPTGKREYRNAQGKSMGESVEQKPAQKSDHEKWKEEYKKARQSGSSSSNAKARANGAVYEEQEQIEELSKMTHARYQDKARSDISANVKHIHGEYGDIAKNIVDRRVKGLSTSSALQLRDRMAKVRKEESELEEGYYKRMATDKEEDARLAKQKEEPPFDPDPPKKKSVVAGKYGSGYSTARHLARQAMQKQSAKYKSVKESLDESRKAEIVKEIMKKKKAKSEDAFQPEPELSSTLTKV